MIERGQLNSLEKSLSEYHFV